MRHRIKPVVLIFLSILISVPAAVQAGWTEDGAPVCTNSGVQERPKILPDGSGGAFIAWNDSRTYTDIYGQRLDFMGRPQWSDGGTVISHGAGFQFYVEIAPDGAGGFIAVWQDSREETHFDIYAQRVGPDGDMLWTADGVPVCTAVDDQVRPRICADGKGGCIITWVDERTSPAADDIYAQRIDAGGNPVWTVDGVTVCTADSTQLEARIVSDGSGGAVIVWMDNRTEQDIYAQRMDSLGTPMWNADGNPVCDLQTSQQYEHEIAEDGSGGAFVTWCDSQGTGLDIRGQRIDSSGNIVFASTGVTLCGASGTQREPAIAFDGYRGAIVAWEDFRNGSENSDVYAQRVSDTGAILYSDPDGILICNSANNVYWVQVLCNMVGEAIIAWEDLRDSGISAHDIYAQRVDGDGICAWTANGKPLSRATATQTNIALASDGDNGVIAAWTDYRNPDWDIYAMRITYSGDYVATVLRSFTCQQSESGIEVAWRVSEPAGCSDFALSRRECCSDRFVEIGILPLTDDGLSFKFLDHSAEIGVEYSYRVGLLENGMFKTLFETGPVARVRAALTLMQNSPNPFNPSTKIEWRLDARCPVRLEVFNTEGRSVALLVNGFRDAGDHEIIWNGAGPSGEPVASGVYMYRLTAGKRSMTKKMVLLR